MAVQESSDIVLARLDTARSALAEAKTIQETKTILDVAHASEILAKRQEMGEEAVAYAHSIKVEALRQLGTMLKETERATGGEYGGKKSLDGTRIEPSNPTPTLSALGLDKKTSKLAQDVASLPEEKLEQVKAGVVSLSRATSAHVAYNTGENEWYTPTEYIEAARKVMGAIDTDPASSDIAQETIRANQYFTKKNSGLEQKWYGKVWLNPPYAQPLVGLFADAVVDKWKAGEFDEALILVNNATETNWFQKMMKKSTAVCFIKGRVRFLDPQGIPGAPLQGQAVLYLGQQGERFSQIFSHFGKILWNEERLETKLQSLESETSQDSDMER